MLWDTHLHLERYGERAAQLVKESAAEGVGRIVAVSMDHASCERTLALSEAFPGTVLPAFGFHPEQPLPDAASLDRLFAWIERHRGAMCAIGEVGLPYYTRKAALEAGASFEEAPYLHLLERFVACAARWDVPIALHAVYEDAHQACELLELYGVRRAHFHWFKGDEAAVERLIRNGYYVSFTPDCLYDDETAPLVGRFPLERILTETDGPWPFEGPFAGRETHPAMIRAVAERIARVHGLPDAAALEALHRNAERLYGRNFI